MRINIVDIFGYYVDGDLFCAGCYDKKHNTGDYLMRDDVESGEAVYICDSCKKPIR